MVHLAERNKGVYGGRMTGGGFGGCTINLVQENFVEEFKRSVSEGYRQNTGREPEIYVSFAADGASRIT
jgi:galactokinase